MKTSVNHRNQQGHPRTRVLLLTTGMFLVVTAQCLAQEPPSVSTQPQSQTNLFGTTATFTVEATGTEPLAYQWQRVTGFLDFYDLAGCTAANLCLTNVQAGNAANYRVVVTNLAGAVTSLVATLTVLTPPRITLHPTPTNQMASVAANVTFRVVATSTPLSYQWRFNGSAPIGQANVLSQTSAVLSLTNAQPANSGDYDVVVSNPAGAVTSRVARLKVFVPTLHSLSSVNVTSNREVVVGLAGEVTATLAPYYDLYPLEASSDLVDWTSLATLRRTNGVLSPVSFLDSDGARFPLRFYRTPTNQFATFLTPPTGLFPVGVTSRLLTDPMRTSRRPFMISIWYPAVPRAGVWPTPFMDPRVANGWWAMVFGGSSAMYRSFHSHALPELSLAGQTAYPIVIYSPGQDNPRAKSLAQIENLASHGYIVVSIDHEDAVASVYPDGRIIYGIDNGNFAGMIQRRVQDLKFVMDELARWNQSDAFFLGRLDLARLGTFGFSLGGATVAQLCASEPRCKAVVCLDGGGLTTMSPFSQPFLYAYLALLEWRPANVRLFDQLAKDAYRFDVKNAAHQDGDDSALVWDTAASGQSIYSPPVEAHLRVARILRIYTLSFFNKYLKGQDDHLLDGPLPDHPEIINYTKK